MAGYFMVSVKVVSRNSLRDSGSIGHNSSLKAAAYISGKKFQEQKTASPLEAAAYISGSEMSDEGVLVADYTRKQGVLFSEVILPIGAPERLKNPEVLWSEIDHFEGNYKNADLFREWICCFENSLSEMQCREIARRFAEALAGEGMVVHYAIHDEKNGNGNVHAHFLAPTRSLTESGEWQPRKVKPRGYLLDEQGERIPVLDRETGLQKRDKDGRYQWKKEPPVFVDTFNDPRVGNTKRWRQMWADLENEYLAPEHQVSPDSYYKQGIDRIPRQRVSKAAYQVQKKLEAQVNALPDETRQEYISCILHQVQKEYRRLYYETSRQRRENVSYNESVECAALRSRVRLDLAKQRPYKPPAKFVRSFTGSGLFAVEYALGQMIVCAQSGASSEATQEATAEFTLAFAEKLAQWQSDLIISFAYGVTKDIEVRLVQSEYDMKRFIVRQLGLEIRELEKQISDLKQVEGETEIGELERQLDVYRERINAIRTGEAFAFVGGTGHCDSESINGESEAERRIISTAERVSTLSKELDGSFARMGAAKRKVAESDRQLSCLHAGEADERNIQIKESVVKNRRR